MAQLRVFNGDNCQYSINTNIDNLKSFNIEPMNYYLYRDISITNNKFLLKLNVNESQGNCTKFEEEKSYTLTGGKAYSLFMNSNNLTNPLIWYEDYVEKPSRGSPLVRSLINIPQNDYMISWKSRKHQSIIHTENVFTRNLTELPVGDYEILLNNVTTNITVHLEVGGVYTLLVTENSNNGEKKYESKLIVITEPNSMSILWLIPQYVVMTLGEVMFSVTGLEFSYSQAPEAMKSVLQACWLLTVAIGNVIVVIIAELALFESQSSEFFLFAGLMLIDMLLFMFMAYMYKPNNQIHSSSTMKCDKPPASNNSESSQIKLQATENID